MTVWCAREGCPASVGPGGIALGHRHCCLVCRQIDQEMSWIQRTATKCPDDHHLTEQWAAIVEASDAWSEYRRLVCQRQGSRRDRRTRYE